jgi:hypothetical protein
MWLMLALLAISVVAVLWTGKRRAMRRYRRLVDDGRVRDWLSVTREPAAFEKIVLANFGFGREVWAVPLAGEKIDNELRAFKDGILIESPPRIAELISFCRSHGLEFTRKIVMWKNYSSVLFC